MRISLKKGKKGKNLVRIVMWVKGGSGTGTAASTATRVLLSLAGRGLVRGAVMMMVVVLRALGCHACIHFLHFLSKLRSIKHLTSLIERETHRRQLTPKVS